jgi:O-6-methylguanine DNA methyltransferase
VSAPTTALPNASGRAAGQASNLSLKLCRTLIDRLAQGLTQAAADAEQIPDDEAHRMATLVLIEEAPRGRQYSAGHRVEVRFVSIEISPPAGVMDQGARNRLFAAVERAVGAAGGRNPWSVIVPCHRVLGAQGQLTGYAGGLERKRALLTLEGVAL